jgi:hypothetical protein
MHVSVLQEFVGDKVVRRGLRVTQDFEAGQVIYEEHPLVSCLQECIEVTKFKS